MDLLLTDIAYDICCGLLLNNTILLVTSNKSKYSTVFTDSPMNQADRNLLRIVDILLWYKASDDCMSHTASRYRRSDDVLSQVYILILLLLLFSV